MNCLLRTCLKPSTLGFALVAIYGASHLALPAGESIIFGGEKRKSDPINDSKFGKELSKPWQNIPEASPFNGMVPPIMPRNAPLDLKKDKRRKAELEEKKNWMLYEDGELQERVEEEENQFGVRDSKMDELQREDGSIRDLTFSDMGRNRGQTRLSGQPRASNAQQKQDPNRAIQQQREREEVEAEAKRDSRYKLELGGTGESEAGVHTSKELDLKSIFEPDKVRNTPKSELSLADVLKSGTAPAVSREQQARRNEFKNLLNTPMANPLAGPSDPINQRKDFTLQPINPVMPKPADPALKSGDPLVVRGGAPNPYNPAAMPDSYSPRGTPGFLPSPFLNPPEPPRPASSSFGFEAPRRPGLWNSGNR
jgi:hypothetical protein